MRTAELGKWHKLYFTDFPEYFILSGLSWFITLTKYNFHSTPQEKSRQMWSQGVCLIHSYRWVKISVLSHFSQSNRNTASVLEKWLSFMCNSHVNWFCHQFKAIKCVIKFSQKTSQHARTHFWRWTFLFNTFSTTILWLIKSVYLSYQRLNAIDPTLCIINVQVLVWITEKFSLAVKFPVQRCLRVIDFLPGWAGGTEHGGSSGFRARVSIVCFSTPPIFNGPLNPDC